MYKSSTPIIPPSNYILPIKTPATSIYNNSKLLLSPSSSISPNKLLSSYELDFDVIGITNEANHCHLNDNDDSNNGDDICGDQPLDLSLKRNTPNDQIPSPSSISPSNSLQPRPSVIQNGYVQKKCDMRRSSSSVTSRQLSEPDVSEHFRRSLSGKWPRKHCSNNYYKPTQFCDNERSLNGPTVLQRKPKNSFIMSSSIMNSPAKIIVNNSGVEIEDHFRKALGAEAYELLRKKRIEKFHAND
ncbi:unnamed protein product [Dracunculus medinensis]|uniref:Uncharacterized protein n=1 Tax=Dracunculus medinensis TaxID=318479 RepID=A0A0N4ULU4_DRAME|nr:unnamed protein product [Dracunculus medinensis]